MKSTRGRAWFRVAGLALLACVLVGVCAAAMPLVKNWWNHSPAESAAVSRSADSGESKLLDADQVQLPADVVRTLGLRTAQVETAQQARPLELFGQFAPNTDRLFRIRARFPGHVAEIAPITVWESNGADGGRTVQRPLQVGDTIKKGDLLAVVWSRDLGEKKSELVDGLSQLRLDEELLERLREAYKRGAVPERSVLEQQRRVEAGRIATERAERTLRSWELTDVDIETLCKEAEPMSRRGPRDPNQYQRWARWEMRAPTDGTIVEKNASLNEYVDTTSLPLFQLADFSQLTVWAYPYEEDLPLLQALPKPISWTIRLKADPRSPELKGTVDLILPIIEPNQRTPILKGHVNNATGRLLSNQSLAVLIPLSAPADEVVVPTTALVEDGQESILLVQPDPARNEYVRRRVTVLRRYQDVVHVLGRRPPDVCAALVGLAEQPLGLGPMTAGAALLATQPLRAGDRVVSSGALLLKAHLEDLQARSK